MWKIESYKASWREALEIFRNDIGLLLLVSLRTLMSVYRSLLHAWFLPITLLVGLVLSLPLLLGSFYTVLVARAARPSMEPKNCAYWQRLVFVDWYLFFGVLILESKSSYLATHAQHSWGITILWYAYDVLARLFFVSGKFWLPGTEALGTMLMFLSPFLILVVLFMLDSEKTIMASLQAVGRAFLMLAYNYPFFLLLYAFFRLILSAGYLSSMVLDPYIPQIGLFGWFFFLFVLYPYWVCVITNFYVKRLHEQLSWYYWR